MAKAVMKKKAMTRNGHHDALLTLREAEYEQAQTNERIDGHCGGPCRGLLGKAVGSRTCNPGNDQRQTRVDGKTANICHEHTHGGEDGDLIGVARKRRVECAVGHIDEGIEQLHAHIRHVSIEQRGRESVVETKDSESRKRNTYIKQVGAIFAVTWIALVDERAHNGVPDDVCHVAYRKHHSHSRRSESVDVGVEEQQVGANYLEDQVLCKVTRAEADALQPTKFVEAFCLLFV